MPFDTIDQGLLALQQHMQHECHADDSFYLPLLGKRFASSEAVTEDLEFFMRDFSADNNQKRVCALFGDGGSGKSVFLKQFTLKLLNEYTPEKPIPLFLSLPLLNDPIHSAIEETLRKIGFDEIQIVGLKASYSFIFILDAYDEIHQLQNLYVSNGLSEWNSKTIISCRSQYLYNKEHTNLYFMPIENEREQPHLLQTLYVAPFNQGQIRHYFELSRNNNVNIPDNDVIEMIPGLQDLITSPFLLKLAVEALPEILARYANASQQERPQLTQTDLYKIFVKQWFERQEKKLIDSGRITEDMPDQKPIFWRYCQSLALEMHKHNLSWLSAEDERFSVYFESDAETEILRSACPIKRTEDKVGFWHESLSMHFVAQTIYQESLNEKTAPAIQTQITVSLQSAENLEQERPQGTIHLRLITEDPVALRNLADEVEKDERYKAWLFDLIERSKDNQYYAIGAANSISVLNAAGVNFSGMNLRNIRISHANLSQALMAYVNLINSDLSAVILANSVLTGSLLCNAKLHGAQFQFGNMSFLGNQRISALACHPKFSHLIAYGDATKVVVITFHEIFTEKRFKGHSNRVESVVWSDDQILISGSKDSTIRIWDITKTIETACLKILTGHTSGVRSLSWSGAGLLASGSKTSENVIRIWNIAKLEEDNIKLLTGHTNAVESVSWSHDRKFLASGSKDGTVRIWSFVEQSEIACIKVLKHGFKVRSVAWSLNGILASGGQDDILKLWDIGSTEEDSCIKILNEDKKWLGIYSVAWSKVGLLASGHLDKIVRVWDINLPADMACIRMFTGHTSSIEEICWTMDGKLASGGRDKTLRLWSIADAERPINETSDIHNPYWLPTELGQYFEAVGGLENYKKGQAVSINTYGQMTKMHSSWIHSIACSHDGKIATGSRDFTVKIWKLDTKSPFHIICTQNLKVGYFGWVYCVTWSPNGVFLASTSNEYIYIWDFTLQEKAICIQELIGHSDTVNSIKWASNKILASGSTDHTIRIWDITESADNCCLQVLTGHTNSVKSVAWSFDGKLLASGSIDGTVRIWDTNLLNQAKHLKTLRKHHGPVYSVAWSQGSQLASGGEDRILRIWSGSDFSNTKSFKDHTHIIWDILWSSDGKFLISASLEEILFFNTFDFDDGPTGLPFGTVSICMFYRNLLLCHDNAIHMLNLEDGINWIMAFPRTLWLQGVNMTKAQGLSFTTKRLLKMEGAFEGPNPTGRQDPFESSEEESYQGSEHEENIDLSTVNIQAAYEALNDGNYQEAADYFEFLIKHDQNNASHYHNCACVYHLLGIQSQNSECFIKADIKFQKARELNSTSVGILVEYANFLRERKQYQKSLSLLDRAIAIADDSEEKNSGLSYDESGLSVLPEELATLLSDEGKITFEHPKVFAYYLKVYCLCAQRIKNLQAVLDAFQALVESLSNINGSELYNQLLNFSRARCEASNNSENMPSESAPIREKILALSASYLNRNGAFFHRLGRRQVEEMKWYIESNPFLTDEELNNILVSAVSDGKKRNEHFRPALTSLVQQGHFSPSASVDKNHVDNDEVSDQKSKKKNCIIS